MDETRLPLPRVYWFHMGSAAFGSLTIAICQFIRLLLLKLDRETQTLQKSNFVFTLVIKCVLPQGSVDASRE